MKEAMAARVPLRHIKAPDLHFIDNSFDIKLCFAKPRQKRKNSVAMHAIQ